MSFAILNPVSAEVDQSALELGLSPAIVEIALHPGDSSPASVIYANTGARPIAATIVTDTLIPIDNVIDQGKRSQFDASSWIELETPTMIIDAGKQETVNFVINVPEDANPGGHYALITLKPGIIQGSNSGDTIILPEISASMFITVAGEIQELAEIVEDDLQISNLTRGRDNKINFRIRNIGNVHILPSPHLTILKDSKPIEVFSLQPQLILPNTEKTFEVTWPTDVSFGKYSLQAELTYGNQSIPLSSAQYEFLVLPSITQFVLLGLLSPFLLLLIFRYKNIPRMMAVLRGHANYSGSGSKFKFKSDDTTLPKPSQESQPISDIAKEIERQPQILGLPDDHSDSHLEEAPPKPKSPTPAKATAKSRKKPKILSRNKIEQNNKTTHITQTEASTIIREKSPFYDPDDEPIEPSRVITIDVSHDDDLPEKKSPPVKTPPKKEVPQKKTPANKPLKRTTTKRKSSTAKKVSAKKNATSKKKSVTKKKDTIKKPSASVKKKKLPSKTPTKKAAVKKRSSTARK